MIIKSIILLILTTIAVTSVAATAPITTMLTIQKRLAGFLDVCQVRLRISTHVHVTLIEDNDSFQLIGGR